ncbi:diguanylate cyclase [Curvibacter sp. APW13]|uniref:GGDEF domain-containing response regulator n=1 Tax=Curvibacter sp. APW13 TaxID=3077236 RepID=UPI0028DF2269|nr:diguanylate cyclase [Curvibacter sp. APW13]MDT8991058.1 diguanylate cyclase [Curvibacter sp. APW13]
MDTSAPPARTAVLIVEDQRALSGMLGSMLRNQCGCDSVIAASLAQAQSALEAQGDSFLAAVCDVNLPDAPYGEAISLVERHGLPVIALTGSISPEVRELMHRGSIVDYVLKKGVVSYEYAVQLVRRLQRNRSLKVLVADDSPSSREVLQRMLQIQGLTVLLAENGADAIRQLEQHRDTKLVLVDYNMPKVDGFEFVLQARRMMGKDKLAIIGISGENRPDVSAQFLKHGANDFISKPYSYEEMTCRINQNLEMLELVESLHHLATRDSLTGLNNRRTFFDRGEALLRQARAAGHSAGVAMMDIDYFKRINDEHGHHQGDLVLQAVAQELGRHFSDELVARLGGEEFVVLFGRNLSESAMRQGLERFREALPGAVAQQCPTVGPVTISMGICCAGTASDASLSHLLHTADGWLYQAKTQGRNRLV